MPPKKSDNALELEEEVTPEKVIVTGSGSGIGLAFSLVSSDVQATTIDPKSIVRTSGLRVYFCRFISVSLIKKI